MSDVIGVNEASSFPWVARIGSYTELIKPRIATMVLVATAVSFLLAWPASMPWTEAIWLLCMTVLGTGLVAGGANTLNQYMELDADALMERTAGRPIPSGRIAPRDAFAFGCLLSASGLMLLLMTVNVLAAALAALSLASYLAIYTPMKRITPLSVFFGAVPGALPMVIGWSAAANTISTGGWILFSILYFWQLPHFAAIAWLFKEDYARGGYRILSVVDTRGTRTDLHVVTHTVALMLASVLPVLYRFNGHAYAWGAVVLGFGFLATGVWFIARKDKMRARVQLLASIVYLPALLGLMILDRALQAW